MISIVIQVIIAVFFFWGIARLIARYLKFKVKYFDLLFLAYTSFGVLSYTYFSILTSQDLDLMNFLNDGDKIVQVLENHPEDLWPFITWFNLGKTPLFMEKYKDVTYFLFNSGALIIIKIHVLLSFINFGNTWINVCFFSTLFFGANYILLRVFKKENDWQFWLIGLLPSYAFWLNAMLKEAIVFFAISLYLHSYKSSNILTILSLVLSVLTLYFIRAHIAYLALFFFLFYIVYQKLKIRWTIYQIVLLSLTLLFLSDFLMENGFLRILTNKYYAFWALPKGEGAFYVSDLSNINGMFVNIALAIPVSLIRPFTMNGFMSTYSTIEGLLVLCIITYCSTKIEWRQLLKRDQVIFAFLLVNLFVIGFVVRNDGALHRYKSTIMLVILTLMLTNTKNYSKKTVR